MNFIYQLGQNKRIDDLEQQVEELKTMYLEYNQSRITMETKIRSLTRKNNHLATQKNYLVNKLDTLELNIRQLQTEIERPRGDAEHFRELVRTMKVNNQQVKAQIERMQGDLEHNIGLFRQIARIDHRKLESEISKMNEDLIRLSKTAESNNQKFQSEIKKIKEGLKPEMATRDGPGINFDRRLTTSQYHADDEREESSSERVNHRQKKYVIAFLINFINPK
jgi:chromosome segregation ATPase